MTRELPKRESNCFFILLKKQKSKIGSCVFFLKVPVSYHYGRRTHLYDTLSRIQTEPRSVDTSDLGVKEEDWFSDEATTTLLGYAEKEVMGHKVSRIFQTASIIMHQSIN